MVSSSQATTASVEGSDDDAKSTREADPRAEITTARSNRMTAQHDKHSKLEAIVKWVDHGQLREQRNLNFDIQHHALYHTAYFKLRASVTAKTSSASEQIPLFLFLAPEAVQTLTLHGDHAYELGPDTICLRFGLKSRRVGGPALVVPVTMDTSHLSWKHKDSSDMWASLQSLAQATCFTVHCRLPRRAMPETRLQYLCETLSNGQVISTPGYANTSGLYGGKGGKIVYFGDEAKTEERFSNESPPAYQDLEPSPPLPSILQDKTCNKRPRTNSDSDIERASNKAKDDLDTTVVWLVAELKQHMVRETSLVNELKKVNAKVDMLLSEQEQLRERCTALEHDLLERTGDLEGRLHELDEELDLRVDYRIDESFDQKSNDIRQELVDYIDETLPNSIRGAFEEATFSARF